MASGSPKSWHPRVRFVQHEAEAILVHLATTGYVKLDAAALPYLYDVLSEGEAGRVAALPAHERRALHELVATLERNGYVVARADAAPEAERDPVPHPSPMRTAYYSVSRRCNLTCRFCYASPKVVRVPYRGDTDASLRAIDVLAGLNVVNLILSGGEPLLRIDLPELVAHGKERIASVGITSNGTLLDFETALRLKDAGTDFVQISMEGGGRQMHDVLRGPGTFDKCVRALEFLRQAGFSKEQVYVTATTTRSNLAGIDSLYAFADQHGVTAGTSFFQPVGRGERNSATCTCDTDKLLGFFADRLRSGIQRANGAPRDDRHADVAPLVPRVLLGCGMGSTTIGVEEDGSMVPCHLCFGRGSAYKIASIYDVDVADRLAEFAARLPTVESLPACRECDVRYFCGGGCWASCYEGAGRVEGVNPYCAFYKRYYRTIVWNLGRPDEVQVIYDGLTAPATADGWAEGR